MEKMTRASVWISTAMAAMVIVAVSSACPYYWCWVLRFLRGG